VGSLACVSRSRKQPLYLQDKYVAAWALDDKASLVALVLAMREIKESSRRPPHDVYFAATSIEELGISGAAYVSRQLMADRTINTVIAAEVAPVAEEYAVVMDERPVVLMKDAVFMYHPQLCRELIATCERLGLGHQEMLVRSFGSDTSSIVKYGYIGRAGCVGFPTENTHGCEVAPVAAIENVGKLLAGYVLGG
jgi:putative aminopeptidase FrvX